MAFRVEKVIYPPGTGSPSHRHEGTASFLYVLSGRGTAWANEQAFPMQQDDLVYFPDRERRFLRAADDCEIRFLSFYVPGDFGDVPLDC